MSPIGHNPARENLRMKPLSRSAAWRCRALLACVVLSLALASGYSGYQAQAQAAFVRRYCTVVNGGITFTGNALGLDKMGNADRPGTNGAIGTFITTDTGVRENSYWPYGTTGSWTSNSSSAILRLPAGSTVLYAELIWSGSYNYGGELTNPSDLDSPVKFTTPLGGPYDVAPDPATSHTLSVNHNYYVRSQNVTDLVRAAGAGTYTVGRVPGTQATSENTNNHAGWTLAVIYENQNEPSRSITLFVGGELAYNTNPTTILTVDGFRTAQAGEIHGRLLVAAGEGDASGSGDQLLFGETEANMRAVSGPNNLVNNFFASQINGEDGNLDTSGTFGNRNHTRSGSGFSLVSGARQGFDITNVDISSMLRNNQTSAVVRGTTNSDAYYLIAVGLQVNIGAPRFRKDAMRADRFRAEVGDIITYTVDLDNTQGTADAVNIVFRDEMPWGMEFIPGSLSMSGNATMTGTNPEDGVAISQVKLGEIVTLTYQARVTAVPIPPAAAVYRNTASWTYQFQSAPVLPMNNGQITTDPCVVALNINRFDLTKSVSADGDFLTYTITVTNTGGYDALGARLTDPIPAGTSYVRNSTYLNGTLISDTSGSPYMPFANGRLINSPGASSGVIPVGESAVVTFQVMRTTQNLVTNTATMDPDGNGPLAPLTASATYPTTGSDLEAVLTDGQDSAVAGTVVNYTVRVTNNGPDATVIDGCILSFTPPAGLTELAFTPAAGSYDEYTGQWTGLSLGPGNYAEMTISGRLAPDAAGEIASTVNVSHLPGRADPNPANNSATDTDAVSIQADLSVAKSDGTDYVMRGETVNYAIIATNNGPSTVTSLFVTEIVPAELLDPVLTTQAGLYNPETHLLSGLRLAPGESVTLTLSGTVSENASGTLENTVNVAPPLDAVDPDPTNNTAIDIDEILDLTVSGYVYMDADHDGIKDAWESGTGLAGLYVKLIPEAGGAALQAVPVDAATGAYRIDVISPGSYNIILDNNAILSDTEPARPAGWLGTEAPAQSRGPISLVSASSTGQNFGLWHGAKVTGMIFRDDGSGGGTANDGVRQAGEAALGGVRVRASKGDIALDTTVTNGKGEYTFWIAAGDAGQIALAEQNPPGYISVGGSAGNTGGSYDRDLDRAIFVCAAGEAYTGVNFADVPASTLSPGAAKDVMAGAAVFFPHVFTAGTAGEVTFSVDCASTPAAPLWTTALYLDADGNGRIDPGEAELTQAQTVTAGEELHLLLKVYAPPGVPLGARAQITLTADLTLRNASPPLSLTLSSLDTATAVTPSTAGLTLTKTVDKQIARPGEELVYTITYINDSGHYLSNLAISDDTPAYTNFISADFGPLPPQLTACAIDAPPIGGTGSIVWTFAGELAPGASGSVTYRVRIEQ